MSKQRLIQIRPLPRIEGHADLSVSLDKDNRLIECRMDIKEAPRFFEDMLKGRSWEYVHHVASRICGVSSVAHQLASIKATEQIFGVAASEQTSLLRKLALYGEVVQSHLYNLGYLVLPDLVGTDSLLSLAQTKKPQALPFIAMHRLGNEITRVVCGRSIHPQRLVPGGFTKFPDFKELRSIRQRIKARMPQALEIAKFFARLKERLPELHRETPGLALKTNGQYAFYHGRLASGAGAAWDPDQWTQRVEEYTTPQSSAKCARLDGNAYRVGALARYNLNHEHLTPKARKAAEIMGISAPLNNPFHNTLAQYVEAVLALEETVILIDRLEETGIRYDDAPAVVKPQAGHATVALEAPGGVLFCEYEYDKEGRIARANICSPSGQNLASLQADLETLAVQSASENDESLASKLALLIRTYDLRLPCSVH